MERKRARTRGSGANISQEEKKPSSQQPINRWSDSDRSQPHEVVGLVFFKINKDGRCSPLLKNPFGATDALQARCYKAVYETRRAVSAPFPVAKLHKNIVADFSHTIGGTGVFVVDSESASGKL
jgi:hypothetical protein